MKALTHTYTTVIICVSMSFAACNSSGGSGSDTNASSQGAAATPTICNNCGTITNIEQMKEKGNGSGVGAIIGAVTGAVVGHQVGDGQGKDIATATGAIGGGIAGNEIEKRIKGTTYFHVTVAMENGGTNISDVNTLNGLAVGSKVKIVSGILRVVG